MMLGSKRLIVLPSGSVDSSTHAPAVLSHTMSQRGGERREERQGGRGGGEVGVDVEYYEVGDEEREEENPMKVYATAVAMARIGR